MVNNLILNLCIVCSLHECDEKEHKCDRKTLEFIKKARKVHGYKYDYSRVRYVRNKEKVIIICRIHGEFLQTPSSHLQRQGCRKCQRTACEICKKRPFYNFENEEKGARCQLHKLGGMVNIMTREYGEKRFIAKITKLGGKVLGKYTKAGDPVKSMCKKGHICYPRYINVQREIGMCRICAKNDPKTAKQNFLTRIKKELGGKVVGEYKANLEPVDCICVNGHHCSPTPGNIQRGQGMCRICAKNDPKTAKQNFIVNITKLGGMVIGEYKRKDKPVKSKCKNGHICYPTPSYIRDGGGMCGQCAPNNHETAKQNFIRKIKELEGIVVGEYKNCGEDVDCICKNGHRCHPKPNNIQQGVGMCGRCSQSAGEMLLETTLTSLNLDSQYQAKHPSIPTLRYDYSFEYKNTLCYGEFHGIQHEGHRNFFDEAEEDFNKRRQRDLLKVHIAKINNIRMIILDHTWSKKPLQEWVEYIRNCLERDEQIIADSELHGWVHEKPSDETIAKYVI